MTINETMYRQQAHGIQNLRIVKIHFDNKKEEEKGFYKLMVSGIPVNALDNGQYLVNRMQRKILDDGHINYQLDK